MLEPQRVGAEPRGAGPRLLAGLTGVGTRSEAGRVDLTTHLRQWGPLSLRAGQGRALLDLVDQAGLRGHGGAWFPTAAKWRSVAAAHGRAVLVANGAEGEPLSRKDATLLARVPHLVLDGAALAAAAVGADRVVAYVPRHLTATVRAAADERRASGIDQWPVEIVAAPDRFLAGEESAAVKAIDGAAALPSFTGLQPVRLRGVGGRPTLVQNVETLAQVALLVRYGPAWFRAAGTPEEPGTLLMTVSGRGPTPVVVEAALGTPMAALLGLSQREVPGYQGALLGGYGGGWVATEGLLTMRLSEVEARRAGASLGAGVVALLPTGCCPVAEIARVVRFLDREKAGQCGPCVHGLGELAERLEQVAFGPPSATSPADRLGGILALCDLVEGRGACRHPDGAARFVRSATSVFAAELARHLHEGPCPAARSRPPVLPGTQR